jgi:hypothetical protein
MITVTCLDSCNSEQQKLITLIPHEIDDPLTNPFSGWEIWAGKVYCDGSIYDAAFNTTAWGDDCPWFGGVLLDMYWKDIQPVDSLTYQWEYMDSIVNYWYERGKTFNIRLWCSWDPGWHSDANSCVPSWAQAGVAGLLSTKAPSVWVPMYSDPSYQLVLWPRIKSFLKEFKNHYEGDRWSSFVQINNMAYGMWGEWWEGSGTGSPIPGTWGSPGAKKAVLDRIIKDWYSVIDTQKYSHMSACLNCSEEYVTDTATAQDILGYRFSLPYGAGLSVNGYEGNNRTNMPTTSQLIDKWAPTNPGIGESNWLYRGPGSITGNNKYIIDFLEDFKTSRNDIAHWYGISSDYALLKTRDSIGVINGIKAGGIGYRFVITSASWNNVSPGGNMTVKSTWVNRNYGKLNAKAPIKWFITGRDGTEYCTGIDSGSDMNQKGNFWRKGNTYLMSYNLSIPQDIPPGSYDVRVAMINNTTKKLPYIRLAINDRDEQGRYILGTVQIAKKCFLGKLSAGRN